MARTQLTPTIQEAIVAYIRAGGFPHVAAEAAGVAQEVFEDWLRRGQRPRADRKYQEFAAAVRQAVAQARLGAEVSALKDRPMDWLRSGPGRETPERVGWTGTVKPMRSQQAQENPLEDPATRELIQRVLTALEPYPEARQAAAQAALEKATESPQG